MITRAQYMEDSTNLHRQYYGQFVTPALKKLVLQRFGAERLKKALAHEKNLNSIPLAEWDRLAGASGHPSDGRFYLPSINMEAIKATNEGMSLSTCVCTLQEAARQICEA